MSNLLEGKSNKTSNLTRLLSRNLTYTVHIRDLLRLLSMTKMHGTTIVAVHRNGVGAIAGDGQVTLGDQIVKKSAVKVRKLNDGKVIVGFAGATADAFTLMEKFEGYLASYKGNMMRAAVETVKEWRTDRALRNLEAMLIVANTEQLLMLSGVGDVITPDEQVVVVGSGGAYAQAAAIALLRHTDMGCRRDCQTRAANSRGH